MTLALPYISNIRSHKVKAGMSLSSRVDRT